MPTTTVLTALGPQLEFWKALVPAAIGLAGVLVGGLIQLFSAGFIASLQRRHRIADETTAFNRKNAETESERNFVRAVLAMHLEGFARKCADTMWMNGDPELDGAANLPDFPKWPKVEWRLLGASEMLGVRDLEVRVSILRDSTEGSVVHGASDVWEARSYYAEGAATIGLEAQRLAGQLRAKAGVEPFRFPDNGANYVRALEERIAEVQEKERMAEERRSSRVEHF
jgi:hypothetical protein